MIFKAKINDSTVEITLHHQQGRWRGEVLVPVAEWASVLPDQRLPLLAVLEGLVDTYCGIRSVDSVTLPHEAIVSLTDSQATAFGLPPAVPLALDLHLHGLIHQADSYVSTAWVTAGGTRELVTRKGAFLYKGRDPLYRIPSPLYELANAAEQLKRDNAVSDAERYTAFAALNEAMPEDGANQKVRLDSALCSIRILHASSFSLQIPTDGEAFDFHPILFSRKSTGRAEEDKRILDEAENLLTPALQETFTERRFRRYGVARECYPIDDGVYVYLDPDLQKALTVVRQKQAASPEERKAFIHAPQRFIREQIGNDLDEDQISSIFVETEQYAHNVIGLGVWSPPVIPWLVREPNNWLPEKFGLKIGEDYIQIKPEDVPCAINEIRTRLEDYAGLAENPSPYECEGADGIKVQIPATKEALDALEGMTGLATAMIQAREEKQASGEVSSKTQEEAQKASGPIFLLVDDNLNDVTYQRNPQRRAGQSDYTHPINLKAALKDHQEIGVRWIIDAWTQGAPGVLLADDMGLGKTLQALTFLAWIIERKKTSTKCRELILIVAPTGLLKNWRKEIETHLREPQLGRICEAFGKALSSLRHGDDCQNDTETGISQLSRDTLRQHDVILTTYETYRDYHHSFAGIRFSAVVMDECQKIKNPKSQVNRALASMNPEFVIAMTGTPIENAIEDLWTIVDRVWPGFLGGLKVFSSTYTPENHASLQELTLKLKSAAATPHVSAPILLRRMKNGILTDFPMKILHIDDCKADMPREQADAYSQAVMRAREANPPPILFTLHALRGISLHPIDPSLILREGSFDSYDAYVRSSARLSQTIKILDDVQRKNEKALLFIETLDMQELMAVILKKRYGLKQRPGIINGKTGVEKIQKLVDAFENDFNFDVMILSPKVGGVGLTLVSANHVIHLSRWWNPAVEDQSTDRAYRIGQKKDVHVYYPMAIHPDTNFRESSFDLKLEKLLARKRQLSQDMLIPPESLEDASTLFEDTVGAHTDPCTITLSELDAMEPTVFERWVLNRAAQNGYIINATQDAWDHGADGIIQHKDTEASFILQCKHSARDQMSEDKAIGDLLRARTKYGIDSLVALTNRHFSPAVVQRMNQLGIRYFDRETIAQWPSGL